MRNTTLPIDTLSAHLEELARVSASSASSLGKEIATAFEMMVQVVASGGTLYFCGNGGSAADAQHIATEYVVRFRRERRAIAAIALTTNTSLLTATANDYSFDEVFARQVEALCREGDVLVLHSTSGNSENLLRAARAARRNGTLTIALSAKGGGRIRDAVDHCIVVPTDSTAHAQEVQLAVQHAICSAIEDWVGGDIARAHLTLES